MANLPRNTIIKSLERFKRLREAVLHEDVAELEYHLQQFVTFCETNDFVKYVLDPILNSAKVDSEAWWEQLKNQNHHSSLIPPFPQDENEEQALRFLILKDVSQRKPRLIDFGVFIKEFKIKPAGARFLSLIVRPFCDELSRRLGEAAHIVSPEIRALQALPPDRIPSDNEVKIFLSHKSSDKEELVRRYHRTLSELGFSPWLDVEEMPAGTNLERGILQGFEESCAAVFFITENFSDENYLATEIDYATSQKRKKGSKFAIITLRFSENLEVPPLLESYVYRTVSNDLDGLHELLRALPIELGPIRWKEGVVK